MENKRERTLANASHMAKIRQTKIGIITFPIGESGILPLSNLLDVVGRFCRHPYLITGKVGYSFFRDDSRIRIRNVHHKRTKNPIIRIPNHVWTQVKIAVELVKIGRDVDVFIFFFGELLLVPMLVAKLLRKHVVKVFTESRSARTRSLKDIFSGIQAQSENVACALSDKLILYSARLIREYGLERYRHKISIACTLFLNLSEFKPTKEFSEREKLVGYVGRLSKEKGVLNFVKAIPKILEARPDLRFMIGGDGELREEIERYVESRDLHEKVELMGWIPHSELHNCLNKVRVLVVPSYTEAGPVIAFEAMACGTLVLGSRVGMMSELLRDGRNGFILKDNSPESIANKILNIFSAEGLDKISLEARKSVEELTYQSAVEAYKSVMIDILR